MNLSRKILLLFITCVLSSSAYAQVQLPKLISDGMVLQRNEELKIWGWASPDEEVTLTFQDQTFKATADQNGEWAIEFPAQEAGGPYEMIFEASNKITVKNILFGDVWVCSGQSNMELTMERVKYTYHDVIANADNSEIRQFLVPDKYDFKKEHKDFDGGSWQSANPKSVLGFSAVAYFFAKEIHEQYQVPVGLINSALGGSPVEAWMSEEALKQFPEAYTELQKFKDDGLIARIQELDQNRIGNWYDMLNRNDDGLAATPRWSQPDVEDTGWDQMNLPGYWADQTSIGNKNGAVWFRKEITVPQSMTGQHAKLWLGRVVDLDSVFVNGEFVGTTGYQYPPRRYILDADQLQEGTNEIAVRVINNSGKGGFIPDKPYYLAAGRDTIDLKGSWKYKLGTSMPQLESQTFIRWKPGGLYNRMIAPLFKYRISGAIWYQGESNANTHEEASKYQEQFSAMINNWREEWNQGKFPFLYVQLANYMKTTEEPTESAWAELRQAQLNTLSLPNTGMAVTIDIGEWNDIHPLNKKDVGHRLALQARKVIYGEDDIVASGPLPLSADFTENHALIKFDNVGKGLTTPNGEELKYFAISNDGKNFVWAQAKIQGDAVKVWSDEITRPNVVRYAWANNPEKANLYNENGLPASPFQISKK